MLNRLLLFTLFAALAVGGFWYLTREPQLPPRPPITAGGAPDTSGFARALAPVDFTFSRDHGPHFDFQTEWWYYTGNLQAENGERFGYQLTFFRRGLTPGAPADPTGLTTNQIYFAHFAISDVANAAHRAVERFSRGAGGLAGASGEPFRVWLEDWSAESLNADGSAVRLRARDSEMQLDLKLRAVKPIVAHGERGLSAKSDQPGNASYYLSFTRMATEGAMTVGGRTINVAGESWFDHEWSTSVLGPDAVGWDWFSLQLSDGRELMLFLVRLETGGVEGVSGGTLVERNGSPKPVKLGQFSIDPSGASWTSPSTQAVYPLGWRIRVPEAGIDLMVEPFFPAQEMQLSVIYWEGAVRVTGVSGGQPVTGQGYVELTGYQGSMQGVLGRGNR
jgi:predicted secreted hydrolase